MKTTPLEPFGARIDADLAEPLEDRAIERLRELFYRHRLLVFPGQDLDREAQRRIAGYLGQVFDTAEDTPYISNTGGGALGAAELAFHSDNEYCPEPVAAITLHAIEVEDGRTSTKFTDGVAAFRRLPAPLCARIATLEARHVLGTDLSKRNREAPADPRWPQAVHPVARVHPVTGETVLYVTEMQTHSIVGLPDAESEALLAELFGHMYDPGMLLEHFWNSGDVILWDNLALQHARAAVGTAPRILQRVSVGRSLRAQNPEYHQAFAGMRADILRAGAATAAG